MKRADPLGLHLVGWQGQGSHGDDLLAACVREIFQRAARAMGRRLEWRREPGDADYVIVGGGTLLGVDSMGIHALLAAAGKPYAIFGTGFRREIRELEGGQKLRLREMLRGADAVYLRGYLSQQFCLHAGAPAGEVVGDPGICFRPEAAGASSDRFDVGVCLRSMGRGGEPQYLDNQQIVEIAAEILDFLCGRFDCRLHFLDLAENAYDSDLEAIKQVVDRLPPSCSYEVHPFALPAASQFSIVAEMDTLVSQRLHPTVVGWALGKAHIALDYQNAKTEDFLGSLGMSEFCLRTDEFCIGAYVTAFERLFAEREAAGRQAMLSVEHWKQKQLRTALGILDLAWQRRDGGP